VTALALFAVTAALAVLLAVLSHQAWPTVLVSILFGVPALYVAWLAVPGVISSPEPAKKLAYGRPAALWNPVDLGVHQVIGGGHRHLLPALITENQFSRTLYRTRNLVTPGSPASGFVTAIAGRGIALPVSIAENKLFSMIDTAEKVANTAQAGQGAVADVSLLAAPVLCIW
jgi:hypothetical protein